MEDKIYDRALLKRSIMASNRSDIQKLRDVFDLDKADLQRTNPQLYYAILGVLDTAK